MPSDRRKDRWSDTTPEQRSAAMTEVADAHRRAAFDRHVDRLIATAPPLTEAQREKLRVLLDNSQPESGAA